MADLRFETPLSMEEIEDNFKNMDFFENLKEGLEEALDHAKGTPAAKTLVRKRSLPTIHVSEIRYSLSMTQKQFAELLGVSCRTVEAWECGKSTPTPTAKKLMYLIQQDHTLVSKL